MSSATPAYKFGNFRFDTRRKRLTRDDALVDQAWATDNDIEVGDTASLTVDLEAGSYVAVCNIVEEEDGETESHYQEGMRASFTVE